MISEEEMAAAIDRIARTEDGRLLYLWCQKRLCAVTASTDGGALNEDNGERSFAAKLMSRMAKGIDESGGRTDNPNASGGSSGDARPVVFVTRSAVSVHPRRSGGRLVDADQPVPGYDAPGAT